MRLDRKRMNLIQGGVFQKSGDTGSSGVLDAFAAGPKSCGHSFEPPLAIDPSAFHTGKLTSFGMNLTAESANRLCTPPG